MKELGEYLKETRINNGVSIDEVAQDLNIDGFLLESVEDGNTRAFKDVLSMKDIVKDYSKYLGLKPEEVIDEFNDYLFEKTSKISLKDILESEKKPEKVEKTIASPYTMIKPKKINKVPFLVGLLGLVLLICLIIFIFMLVRPRGSKVTNELRDRGGIYELA